MRHAVPVIIFSLILGGFYGYYYNGTVEARERLIYSYEGLFTQYIGSVHKIQKRADYYDEYIMRLEYIGKRSLDNTRRIYHILRVPKNYTLFPGEQYSYTGKLSIPQDFDNFAYRRFLQSRAIYFRTSTQSLEKLQESPAGILYQFFVFREYLLLRSESIFPHRESLLLSGVLFGAKEHLPSELRTMFNNSGLTHFITTSGFHVSLVILFLSGMTLVFPIYIRIGVIILGIGAFAIFVGYGAPVVRASIMGIIGYMLLQLGGSVRNFLLIVLTLTSMVLISPLALLYDVSFQLSFLAVLGILFTQSFFKKIFSFLPNFLSLRDACVLTFSAFAGLFPLLFFQFGQVSLLTPIANMLVAWTIPPIMLGGAMLLLLDFFSQSLAFFLSYPIWILLRFDIWVVEFIGSQEWSLMQSHLGEYSSYAQMIYLFFLAYFITYLSLKRQRGA